MSGGKGDDQADAAKEAARLQQRAVESGIQEQRAAFADVQELQAPFLEMGTLASQLLQGQQRFEDQPFFRQLMDAQRQQVERQAAAQGMLGSGQRLAALQDAQLQGRMGFINTLMQPGQQAANLLSQGRFGLGGQVAEGMAQQANAQASGIVGAANAEAAAQGQLFSTLGMLGGAALGGPMGASIGGSLGGIFGGGDPVAVNKLPPKTGGMPAEPFDLSAFTPKV